MPTPLIKNIVHEQVVSLREEIAILPGQIVSKTLAQNAAVSMTLFAFDQGETISTHDSDGDAFVLVLEGAGQFTVDAADYTVREGETLVMSAKKPHAVYAAQPFKMLLLVIFPSQGNAG